MTDMLNALSVEVQSLSKNTTGTVESFTYHCSISKNADGSNVVQCEVASNVIEDFHNKMLEISKKIKTLFMPNFPHKDTFEDDYETCTLATNVYFSQLIAAIKMCKKEEAITILTSFLDGITSQSNHDSDSQVSSARTAQSDFSAQLQAQTSMIERVEANQKQTNDALLAFSTVIQDFGMRIGRLEGQRDGQGYGNNSANSSRRSSMNPTMDESSMYSGTDYGDIDMLSPDMIQNFSVGNARYSGRSVASDITASTAGFSSYSHEVDRDNFDSTGPPGHFPSAINGNMPPHLFNGGVLHMGQDGKPALRRTSSGATTNSNDTRALGVDDDHIEGVDDTTQETTTTANNSGSRGLSMSMSPRSTLVRQLSGKHGSSSKASRQSSISSVYHSPSIDGTSGRDSLRRGSTESYKSYENWQSRRSARLSARDINLDDGGNNSILSGSTSNSVNTSIDNSGINDFEGLDWEIYGDDPSNITHSYQNSPLLPTNVIPHNMNKSINDEIVEQILSLIKPQHQQISFRNRIYLYLRKHTRKVLRCRLYQVGMHALRCTLSDDPLCATVIVKGGDSSKWYAVLGNSLNKTATDNVSSSNSIGNGSYTQQSNNFSSGATVSSFGSGGLMTNPDSKQNSDDDNSKGSNRTLVSGSKIKNVSLLGPDTEGENGNDIMDAASVSSGNVSGMGTGGVNHSKRGDQFNIQFLYDALPVKISANKLNEMCLITFIEQFSVLVGRDNLFKDTLLLVRAWWIYETTTYLGTSIKHYLNDWSICIMVSAIFNRYHEEIHHPLQALAIFLAEYSSIDWYQSAITLQGVVPLRPIDPANPDGEAIPWLSNPHPSHLVQSNLIKKYWFVYNVNPQVLEQMSAEAAAANAAANAAAMGAGEGEDGDEGSMSTGGTPVAPTTTTDGSGNKSKPPPPPPPPRGSKDNGISPSTSRSRLDSDVTTVTSFPIQNGTPEANSLANNDNSVSKSGDGNGVSPDGTRASFYSNTVNVHAFDDSFISDFDALPEYMKPQQKVQSFVRSYANIVNPLENSNLFTCTDPRKGKRRLKYIAKAFETGAKKLAYALRLDLHHHTQNKANSDGQSARVGMIQGGVSAISHFFGATTMRYCSGVRPDSFYGNLLYPLPPSFSHDDEEVQIDSDEEDTIGGHTTASKGASYSSASLQTLWKDLLYCNLILCGQVSATALSSMIDDILIHRGALPVGEVGKQLQDSNCVHNIGAKLKERFCGLKRFLQHYPNKYLICTDHPYNPHTFLFNQLSAEDKKMIANGEITTKFISKFKKSRPKKRHSIGGSSSSVNSAYGNSSTNSNHGAPPGFPGASGNSNYWNPHQQVGNDIPYNVSQQYPPTYRHSISTGNRPTGMIPGPPGGQYSTPNQLQQPIRSGSMNMGVAGYPPQMHAQDTSKRHSIGALPPPPQQHFQHSQGPGHLGIATPTPILIPNSKEGGFGIDKALISPGGGKSQILQAIQKARQHQVTHGVPINATDLGSIGLEDDFGSNPNMMAMNDQESNSKGSGNSNSNSNGNSRGSNISNANSDMNAFWSDNQELKLTDKR